MLQPHPLSAAACTLYVCYNGFYSGAYWKPKRLVWCLVSGYACINPRACSGELKLIGRSGSKEGELSYLHRVTLYNKQV